jgi:uncharacterized alpha/beta hydrolase family protein
MKTIGSLILLISLALIVIVGVIVTDDLVSEANTSESGSADAAGDVISPILTVLGFGVLIVGSMIAVSAFS